MEYKIRSYVDELFSAAPKTQRAYELKIELTQNLLDKYHTLLGEGKSEDDAFSLTVMSIGDINELFEGLGDGPAAVPVYVPQPDGARRSAMLTAVAIMMYILSVVPVIILGAIGIFEVFGVVLMFLIIAAATGLLIYTSMTRPKRNMPDGATVVSEFKNWQASTSQKSQLLKSIRAAFWPLVLAVYFMISFLTGKWAVTWIIFLIAPAVEAIIKAVFTLSDK